LSAQEIIQLDVKPFLAKLAEQKGTLVDVRTTPEFNQEHIKDAIHIDFLQSARFDQKFAEIDKSAPVFLYCAAGGRSNAAAQKLKNMGFLKIYDLKGGFSNYKKIRSEK
tara:strand:+ start:161 stop:487 length:327 start_codon:yes stop_codon:yes gene_type:complete